MTISTNQNTNAETSCSSLLRKALLANATFSALCGTILLVAAKALASLLGPVKPSDMVGIAVSLMVFSAALVWTAKPRIVNRASAWIFVVLDVGWVMGSAAVIFAGVLTTTGNWMVGIVADIVLLFAVAQFLGIRKLRGASAD